VNWLLENDRRLVTCLSREGSGVSAVAEAMQKTWLARLLGLKSMQWFYVAGYTAQRARQENEWLAMFGTVTRKQNHLNMIQVLNGSGPPRVRYG
jgi:hypothetical protein